MADSIQQPEQSPAGDPRSSVVVSTNGIILAADPTISVLLGYPQENLIGFALFDLGADSHDRQNLEQAVSNNGEMEFPCSLISYAQQEIQFTCLARPGGEQGQREIYLRVAPGDNPDGHLAPAGEEGGEIPPADLEKAVRQLSQEVERLKQVEKRLRESEEFFREGFLQSPEPALVWHKEPDGEIRLLLANQKAKEFSEGMFVDFIGLAVEDVFSKTPHIASYVREAMASNDVGNIEFTYILPSSGEEKWISASYIRITDTHLVNILRDVTGEKEKRLWEEGARNQIELLREAMASFTAILNIDQLKVNLMEYLKRLIPYDRALLFLLQGVELECVAVLGFPNNNAYIGRMIPTSSPQFEALNRNRQPLYLINAEEYKPFQKLGDLNSGKAWLGVPLFGHGQMTGYLSIYSASPGIYGAAEADLAATFAGEASIAIENARLFEQLQEMATMDGLLEVYNRRYFYELAEIEFRRTRRYLNPLSLLLLDVDNFKRINDSFGHTVGDQVLKQLAKCIQESTREADLVGRYGGEEFVILMPETNLTAAAEGAERLRKYIESCFFPIQSRQVTITVSLGAATLDENCKSFDDLVVLADEALYRAKEAGKNQVAVCQPKE